MLHRDAGFVVSDEVFSYKYLCDHVLFEQKTNWILAPLVYQAWNEIICFLFIFFNFIEIRLMLLIFY